MLMFIVVQPTLQLRIHRTLPQRLLLMNTIDQIDTRHLTNLRAWFSVDLQISRRFKKMFKTYVAPYKILFFTHRITLQTSRQSNVFQFRFDFKMIYCHHVQQIVSYSSFIFHLQTVRRNKKIISKMILCTSFVTHIFPCHVLVNIQY